MKRTVLSFLFLTIGLTIFAQVELIKDSKTGKFGFTDENGDWVIQPQFDEGEDFFDYAFTFVKKGGKWGLINRKGETILPFEYGKPGYGEYDDELIPIAKNKKHGMVNKKTGTEIITCQYDERLSFREELYWNDQMLILAIKDNKAGLIDKEGNVVINFLYDNTEEPFTPIETALRSGSIQATQNKKSGLIDNAGNVLVPFQYDRVEPGEYPDTLLFDIAIKKKFGVYSAALKRELVTPLYDKKIFFEESGYALVSRKKKFGVIDRSGKEVVGCALSMAQAMDQLDKLTNQ